MNNKYFFLSIALISLSFSFGQYTTQTGLRISDATSTTPSPGIKFSGSADTDGVLYNSKFINNYGLGFYNKSNGDSYNNGMNTYLSGYFGLDFFTNSQLSLRISREGNVGIGTENPTEKLQIGNAFAFHSGGHDIIGFGYTPSTSTNLNANAHSAEIRFKKTEGILSLGISQDNVSNPTPAIEIWKNNNVTLSYYNWGKVGIGTNNPDAKLTVNGDIHAKEVKIDLAIAPDYVFEKYYDGYSTLKSDYKMPTLQEVEAYTKENKHLPEVPSAQEIKENGLKLGEMNAILLQKVEELTLYLIEQNKEIEKLKAKEDLTLYLIEQNKEIEKLRAKVDELLKQ